VFVVEQEKVQCVAATAKGSPSKCLLHTKCCY
jgi:hypothetical protein